MPSPMGPAPAYDDNDDDGHYHPPPPPPIRISDPITAAAIIAVVGAPVVMVLIGILRGGLSWFAGTLLTLAFLSGFATLVIRAKPRPSNSDSWSEGPDNGAVL